MVELTLKPKSSAPHLVFLPLYHFHFGEQETGSISSMTQKVNLGAEEHVCAVVLKSGSIPGSTSYELYDLGKLRDVLGKKKKKMKQKTNKKEMCLSFFISRESRTTPGTSDVLNNVDYDYGLQNCSQTQEKGSALVLPLKQDPL